MAIDIPGNIDRGLVRQTLQLALLETWQQGKPFPFTIDLPFRGPDPLAWLAAQKWFPKFYWKNRDGTVEIAAAGAAQVLQAPGRESSLDSLNGVAEGLSRVPRYSQPVIFAGMPFDRASRPREPWRGLPETWLIQPELAYVREENRSELRVAVQIETGSSRADLERQFAERFNGMVREISRIPEAQTAELSSRSDRPDFKGWADAVDRALQSIAAGDLQKVVLARETRLDFGGSLRWPGVFRALQQANRNTHTFLVALENGTAFMGASPERLFHLSGSQLSTEAISGTAFRGEGAAEEQKAAAFLLNDPKNLLEHRHVVEFLRQALEPLARSDHAAERPRILRQARVLHLHTPVSAKLRAQVTLADVLGALHPTPAVAGRPKAAAMEFIRTVEPFHRGWFAGPLGVFTRRGVEFLVAIRSFLLRGQHAWLYAGAGIVPGSDARAEWEELESKISLPLQILEGSE